MIARRLLFGLAAALVALPLAMPAAAQQASMVDEVKKRGTLRVGLDTFRPWAMRAKSGEIIGFEVDVAKRLAADLGVKLEVMPTAWDGIIPALIAGKFDVIIGGMSITPARNLTVNFTDPYATSGVGIVASTALAKGWTKLEDFNKPEVTIVARRATPAAQSVARFFPKATLRQYDAEAPAIQEVIGGRAHAMVGSVPLPAHSVKRYPDKLFVPVAEPYIKSIAGMALRKGDPDSLNLLNNWVKLRTLDGFLEERSQYWFGTLDWEDQIGN
ncbi:MAG: transporter substrate-binding domain-containing protein [Thalassobaculales bacterium]